MAVDELFGIIVGLFAASWIAFLIWWIRDIRRTNLAIDAAVANLSKIGISLSCSPKEVSEKFRTFVQSPIGANDHEVFILIASMYLLRHHLNLSCVFFAKELVALPVNIRKRLLETGDTHIQKEDAQSVLPNIEAPELAFRIAERLDNNIEDLKLDLKKRHLLVDDQLVETSDIH